MKINRLSHNPIITPASSPTLGDNINGPSLIRVPQWVTNPLGRYYLYFAHHKGKHIRLAFADSLEGPWQIHEPGAMSLADSLFPVEIDNITEEKIRAAGSREFLYAHIASPDIILVPELREVRMYYHGMQQSGEQVTRVAVSRDGLHFKALPEVIARPYLRMFRRPDAWYGMAMPGIFYRSDDGLTNFEQGPMLFGRQMRHAALAVRGDTLYVFWTRVGDAPERILLSKIDVAGNWQTWQAGEPVDVLAPEHEWEGAELPLAPSVRGAIEAPANQLRDPALFHEEDRSWLLYSVAGESGIAIAAIDFG